VYARSYGESTHEEESARALPCGYRGTAFEVEERETAPPSEICESDCKKECEEEKPRLLESAFAHLPFFKEKGKPFGGFSLGSLFSEGEDLLLIGIFIFLLLSRESDPLCAAAVLILFFSDKF
jgi:hypothetical protein